MFPLTWLLPLMSAIMCLAGYKGKVSVSQHPGEITASVGMTAMIACEGVYHNTTPVHTDMYWYKGVQRKHRVMAFSEDSDSLSSQDGRLYIRGNLSKDYNILVISNLTLSDSGVYICEVSVSLPPPHMSGYGEGTRLNVRESNSCETLKATKEMWQGIVLPAALVYSLVVTVMVVVLSVHLCGRKRSESRLNPEEASRVQEESHLNSFSGRTMPLSTDRVREAHNQEYEDMALIRTRSQKLR
ncbi:cytotoxic T-lymphocyte protein 4-like isoform X2 [Heterodontus francisci]|uniref:cytotoxic T-lymphocyte protein 4-like isoform X2 n=1 Tax=Heterodontus francisci TaxID=7792 RepID=UPI00355B85EC